MSADFSTSVFSANDAERSTPPSIAQMSLLSSYRSAMLVATHLAMPIKPLSTAAVSDEQKYVLSLHDSLRLPPSVLIDVLNGVKRRVLDGEVLPSPSRDPRKTAYVKHAFKHFGTHLEQMLESFPHDVRTDAKQFLVSLDVGKDFVDPYLHLLAKDSFFIPAINDDSSERLQVSLNAYVHSLSEEQSISRALRLPKRLRAFSTSARRSLPLLDWGERRRRKRGLTHPQEYAIGDEEVVPYAAWHFLHDRPGSLQFIRESYASLSGIFPQMVSTHFLDANMEYGSWSTRLLERFGAGFFVNGSSGNMMRKAQKSFGVIPLSPTEQTLESRVVSSKKTSVTQEDLLPWFEQVVSQVGQLTREYRARVSGPLQDPVQGGLLSRAESGSYGALEDALNADAGKIFQYSHVAGDWLSSFLVNPGQYMERIILAGLTVVPFLPKKLRTSKKKIASNLASMMLVRSLFRSKQPSAVSERYGSVIPPNRTGSFIHDHRYLLGAVVGWKLLRNLGDGSRHGPVSALTQKVGDILSSGNFTQLGKNVLEMGLDVIEYDASESHWKLGGDIEAEILPASQELFRYLSDHSLGVIRNDWRKIEKGIGKEIRVYPDNIISRFAAGLFAMERGLLEDAKEQLLDVSGWLSDKRLNSRIDELDRSDQRFLTHQIHGASLYYLAKIEASRGREQEAVRLLQEAYAIDRKDASGSAEGFGISRSLPDLLQTRILAPLNFGNRLLIVEHAAQEYGPASAIMPLQTLHGDISLLGETLQPADNRYVGRIASLAKKFSVPLPRYD